MSGPDPHAQAKITAAATSFQPMDIGLRLMLIAVGGLCQTLAETLAFGRAGAIPGSTALLIFISSLTGVLLLWLALWRWEQGTFLALKRRLALSAPPTPRWLRQAVRQGTLVLLLLAALWSLLINGALLIGHPLDPANYDSDAAAFVHYQAEDVLQGINPYTDLTGFWHAIQQFPLAGATPLRRGQFSQQEFSPPDASVVALLQSYLHDPAHAGPEFDAASLHSYPAGAFLVAVPFIWAGLPSTQPLYLLCLLLLFGLLLWWTPQGFRWRTLLLLTSLSIALTLTLRSSFEVICILCVIFAWGYGERHPIVAALLLGLGCSVKQLAWLFVPFFLIRVAKRAGWRQAVGNALVIGLTFFAINAPFIFASPSAWASSMLLPLTEAAFPGGIGLITLTQGGWLPLFPSGVYTTLEGIAFLALLMWFSTQQFPPQTESEEGNNPPVGPSADTWGLFLAPLPLLLASRSLIAYTMFLPVLALAALLQQVHSQGDKSSREANAIFAGERQHIKARQVIPPAKKAVLSTDLAQKDAEQP